VYVQMLSLVSDLLPTRISPLPSLHPPCHQFTKAPNLSRSKTMAAPAVQMLLQRGTSLSRLLRRRLRS
jgi:hypothetical protein